MRLLVCQLLMLLGVLSVSGAEERRHIRVAFRPEPCYAELGPDGSRTGFAVELINALAARCRWKVEWVDVPWGETFAYAKQKKVDIVPCPINTPGVRGAMLVGHVPIGFWRMSLFALSGSQLDGHNPNLLDGLVVGVPRGHVMLGSFKRYFDNLGVKSVFKEYPDRRTLERALFSGEVGAVFSEPNDVLIYEKVLFTLPSEPMYIAVAHGEQPLLDEIDRVLGGIVDNEPELLTKLQHRYFRYNMPATLTYSAREMSWIDIQKRQHRVFKVDISPIDGYFKRYDPKRGTFSGSTVLFIDELKRLTGLDFEVSCCSDEEQLEASFAAGGIDALLPYSGDKIVTRRETETSKVILIDIAQAICTKRLRPADVHNNRTTISISSRDTQRMEAYRELGIGHRLVICDGVEAAFKALDDGRADCFIGDYPVVRRLVEAHPRTEEFDIRLGYDFRYVPKFPVRVSPRADSELVSVISKALGSITTGKAIELYDAAEAQEADRRGIPLSKILHTAGPVVLLILIVIVVSLLMIRRRMSELLHRSEISLQVAQQSIEESTAAKRELSDALDKAELAAQSKTNFLATMSHEIRTPLNAVVGYSEFLSAPDITREKVQEYASGIALSANALLSLINDVLDISKFESGKREGLDLRVGESDLRRMFDELRTIFTIRCQEKGLGIDIEIAADFPRLVLDGPRFRQVLFNLVGNAVKFTDRGGITVKAEYADSLLTVTVQDTGIGITPKGMKHIFDPFVQDMESRRGRVYAGTGLGLPIVKRLVESSSGEVTVESKVGQGSAFTIRIPAVKRIESEPKPVPTSTAGGVPTAKAVEAGPRQLRALVIVDDVMMNRKILELHCKKLGIKDIRVFDKASDVVSHLESCGSEAGAELPELVLSDMWMPGMDGAQLSKAVKEKWPLVTVVAVTADTDPGNKFDMSSFDGMLAKPVTGEKLQELLDRIGFVVREAGEA